MLNAMSWHYMAVFIHATSTLSFIALEYKLWKPTPSARWEGQTNLTSIPCYPAHTHVSNINYTLCEWCCIHLLLHKQDIIRMGFPSNNAKSKPSIQKSTPPNTVHSFVCVVCARTHTHTLYTTVVQTKIGIGVCKVLHK